MSAFSELPVPHFRSNNGLEGVPSRPPADSAGPHRDTPDDWLDEALRTIPLPDGFLTRMSHLAVATPCDAASEPVSSDEHFSRRAPGRVR